MCLKFLQTKKLGKKRKHSYKRFYACGIIMLGVLQGICGKQPQLPPLFPIPLGDSKKLKVYVFQLLLENYARYPFGSWIKLYFALNFLSTRKKNYSYFISCHRSAKNEDWKIVQFSLICDLLKNNFHFKTF